MKDAYLPPEEGLAPAENAVRYLLWRVKQDPDLAHHMVGTEALRKLCVAEAGRLGKTPEEVEDDVTTPAHPEEPAKLVRCRRLLTRIAQLAGDDRGGREPRDKLLDQIRELADRAP